MLATPDEKRAVLDALPPPPQPKAGPDNPLVIRPSAP